MTYRSSFINSLHVKANHCFKTWIFSTFSEWKGQKYIWSQLNSKDCGLTSPLPSLLHPFLPHHDFHSSPYPPTILVVVSAKQRFRMSNLHQKRKKNLVNYETAQPNRPPSWSAAKVAMVAYEKYSLLIVIWQNFGILEIWLLMGGGL